MAKKDPRMTVDHIYDAQIHLKAISTLLKPEFQTINAVLKETLSQLSTMNDIRMAKSFRFVDAQNEDLSELEPGSADFEVFLN